MKFGKTLSTSVFEPWKDHYVDYTKLKSLLREKKDNGNKGWTDDDEARFAEELLNAQLEKVNTFQQEKYQDIKTRTSDCEVKLTELQLSPPDGKRTHQREANAEEERAMRDILVELNSISDEISHLERFSRVNFTGFRKIVKKHDKRRGSGYKLRAILSARLAELPLNTDDYSPLLYRLSAMYSFIRHYMHDEHLGEHGNQVLPIGDEEYESIKFFVHPDDLVEVKTLILRHLPVLVYNPTPSKEVNTPQNDPSLTSIYFDSNDFVLYKERLDRRAGASSLRLRWSGSLEDNAEVKLERKTLAGQDSSRDQRLQLKQKYIVPFILGEYTMDKKINRLRERAGDFAGEAESLATKVTEIQQFIASGHLRPLVRATYKTTAFQVPGDHSIRVSIDTDLKFGKDNMPTDTEGSAQNKSQAFPASKMAPNEMTDFPWAVLTIKVLGNRNWRSTSWVHDLTSSHLLREAPKFSKFVHGIASLYEDTVTELPFWMSLMDTDIRRDPQSAFQEEQTREEQLIEETQAVGSYGGTPRRKSSIHPYSIIPSKSGNLRQAPSSLALSTSPGLLQGLSTSKQSDKIGQPVSSYDRQQWLTGIREILPTFSTTKYSRSRRRRSELPPGVEEPTTWIKDLGPVKVEPKVWLANQRTFIKWQNVSILLASLSLALYNSAGRNNIIASALGIVFTIIAVVIAAWGLIMYQTRSQVIRMRRGDDLDNVLGPVVVCVSLGVALCANLALQL